MFWCIVVDNVSHAVLGDYDPTGFAAQRSCDQRLVMSERVVFGMPDCPECVAIKKLMATIDPPRESASEVEPEQLTENGVPE